MSGLKDQLVGAWRLVSLEIRHSDGTTTLPLGPGPAGLFMFDAENNFSVQSMDPARSAGGTDGYSGSWGTYVVPETDDRFILTQTGASAPFPDGATTVRHVNIEGRTAVFNSEPQTINGQPGQYFITWQKVAG